MKKLISVLLLFAITLSLTSCSLFYISRGTPKIPGALVVDIDVPPTENTATTPEEAIAGISVDIMKSLYKGDENILVSPVSISLALGMTSGGAKGETLSQFEKLLGRGVTLQEMYDFYTALTEKLDDSEKVDIEVANSIWIRDNKDMIKVEKSFIDFVDEYYDSEVYTEPFNKATVSKINSWVKDNTDGMIKNIIDDISPETVMYLINALAFDAEWQREYTNTSDNFKFTNCAGEIETVTGMFSNEGKYLEDENTTGFIKNYKGGEYGFAVFLPNEDIDINDYVSSLTGEKLMNMLSSVQTASVETKLPKFTFEYSTSLVDTLKAMGFTDAFNSDVADLSGIGTSSLGNLYISDVIHKTFIEVAEKGTKAAAVTAVQIDCESAAIEIQKPKVVTVDRPFVFAIIDNYDNTPLFMGTVLSVE